jgi:hypothetical protein
MQVYGHGIGEMLTSLMGGRMEYLAWTHEGRHGRLPLPDWMLTPALPPPEIEF